MIHKNIYVFPKGRVHKIAAVRAGGVNKMLLLSLARIPTNTKRCRQHALKQENTSVAAPHKPLSPAPKICTDHSGKSPAPLKVINSSHQPDFIAADKKRCAYLKPLDPALN